jgi:hypothetical protein
VQVESHNVELLIRFLYYLGGIVSTVVGAWLTSKIRFYYDNRALHHQNLKAKLLTPIREALATEYTDLVRHSKEVVSPEWGQQSIRQTTTVIEPPGVHRPLLKVADPRDSVAAGVDEVLLEDAKENHYSRLLYGWEKIVDCWTAHARRCKEWVLGMAVQILQRCGLQAFPSKDREP